MHTAPVTRAERSQEKRAHIYRVAMQLFKRQGYNQTTIRDICREADISNGTFYHFFGDKSGVVLEFFQRIQNERDTYITPSPARLAHPFQSIFQYFIHVAALQDLIGKEFARETMYSNPDVLAVKQLNATRQSCLIQMSTFLQAAVDAGVLPADTQPWQTAEFLLIAASGVFFHWITLSENESSANAMRRLLPKYIAAVTDEKLDTAWLPVAKDSQQA